MTLMIIGEIKYLTDKITKDSGVKAAIFFYFIIIVMLVIKISLVLTMAMSMTALTGCGTKTSATDDAIVEETPATEEDTMKEEVRP